MFFFFLLWDLNASMATSTSYSVLKNVLESHISKFFENYRVYPSPQRNILIYTIHTHKIYYLNRRNYGFMLDTE